MGDQRQGLPAVIEQKEGILVHGWDVHWEKRGGKWKMKQQWITAALALGLAVTLTACGKDSGSTMDTNMTGSAGRAGYTGQNTTVGRAAYDKNHTTQRRTAYDYLHEGRYTAGDNGAVKDNGTSSAARDFTQDARDLMRDAGNAVGDAGKAVGDAIDRVGGGVRDATRDMTKQ